MQTLLEVVERLCSLDQEGVAVVPEGYPPLLSRALDAFGTVVVLGSWLPPAPQQGRWRRVDAPAITLDEPIASLPRSTLKVYEEVASRVLSYVSSSTTRYVLLVARARDYTSAIAYEILKLAEASGASPHVHLVVDVDHGSMTDLEKLNLTSLVGRLISSERFSVIPFSIDRVSGYASKLGQVEYVEKCLARVLVDLIRSSSVGVYVPVCLRVRPASVFKDAGSIVDVAFYAYTGLHKAPAESVVFGELAVWGGMRERLGSLSKAPPDRLSVRYVDEDEAQVCVLLRYSLRGLISEGVKAISEKAQSAEAVEVLARFSRFQDRVLAL